jgi:hypothetical protein
VREMHLRNHRNNFNRNTHTPTTTSVTTVTSSTFTTTSVTSKNPRACVMRAPRLPRRQHQRYSPPLGPSLDVSYWLRSATHSPHQSASSSVPRLLWPRPKRSWAFRPIVRACRAVDHFRTSTTRARQLPSPPSHLPLHRKHHSTQRSHRTASRKQGKEHSARMQRLQDQPTASTTRASLLVAPPPSLPRSSIAQCTSAHLQQAS